MAIDGGLWAWLGPKCKMIEGLHILRVENSIGSGYPDVDACFKGRAFKIELKHGETFKKSDAVTVVFQKEQPGWIKKRWRCGGNVWVLIKLGMGHKMRLYLIRGCDIGGISDGEKVVWKTSERYLSDISVITPNADVETIIRTAAGISF
jgi:hypothetical protein